MATIDIYARVSQKRRDDTRERSPEGQIAACRARLDELGHTAGEVLTDPGRSAWNPQVKRPAWTTLMDRLEAGESDGLIVFDLERFARQPEDGERLIKIAARGILVLDSESEYDLTSPNGKKSFRDAMNAAAYYSDRLSTRVKRGKKLKAAAGEPSCSSRPFGFRPGGVEHHPKEAPILQEMVGRVLAGESQDVLIADLNARGITTTYAKKWNRTGLRQVLLRPLNAALVEHNGQIAGVVKGAKPLIDPADHHKLVAMFAARRRGRPPSPHYLCSGITVCALCGTILTGRPRMNMKPYDDGSPRRQYWCNPSSNGGCGKLAADQRAVDAVAQALALAVLADPKHAAQAEAHAADAREEIGRLDTEIAEAERVARELGGRLGRGEITLDRYDAVIAPLDRRLDDLREQRKALGAPPAAVPAESSAAAWAARWEAANAAERRDLLRQALRGRQLVLGPADPHDRGNVTKRLTVR